MVHGTHNHRGERKPHDLYRLYGDDEELLYIGISYSALARLAQHRETQSWYGEVRRADITQLGTISRQKAEEIERDAIRRERPTHNVVHNNNDGPNPSWSREALELDSTWIGHEEFQALASAIQAVAQRCDEIERQGGSPPSREEFISTVGAMAATAWMGDTCQYCGPPSPIKVYQPRLVQRNSPTSVTAAYICDCWNIWRVGWAG